jgi:hypothetical protein
MQSRWTRVRFGIPISSFVEAPCQPAEVQDFEPYEIPVIAAELPGWNWDPGHQ